MSITIRNYDPKDKQAVLELARQNIEGLTSVRRFSLTDRERARLVKEDVAPALETSGIFKRVASHNGKPVGFITYEVDRLYGKIHHLAVQPELQKTGIGRSLLQDCLSDFKSCGVRFAHLEITSDHPAPFYKKHGFRELKYPDMKYGSSGIMGIDMGKKSASLPIRCIDSLRLRRPVILATARGAFFSGLVLATLAAIPSPKQP